METYEERESLREKFESELHLLDASTVSYFLDTYCHTDDNETNHIRADDILLKLLADLGLDHAVYSFDRVPKWYN